MLDSPYIQLAALPLIAYLIGSIPVGYLIGRAKGVDIRTVGSRNIGATNVGRVLGRKWGYLCFALDVLKGFAPVFLCAVAFGNHAPQGPPYFDTHGRLLEVDDVLWVSPWAAGVPLQARWLAVGVAAILGHVFPVWLKFRGGKGVATSLGAVLGFYPYFTWAGLAAFAVWIVVVRVWRYVSLASIVAAISFQLLFVGACLAFGWPMVQLWPMLAFAIAMATLVIVRHRANIGRLLAGTENKIGERKPEPGENGIRH